MTRSISRSAARLAAVQALYQQEMEGTPTARLLKEFHDHRLGAIIEDAEYVDVAHAFYDKRESGFVNGLLDAIAKEVRPARAG